MLFGRRVVSALVACAGVVLAGCVAQPPAAQTSIPPTVTGPPPAVANWQWSDAGPAVYLNSTDINTAGNPVASLSLICNSAVPSLMVTWDSPVAAGAQSRLSYRFDGQPGSDVSVAPAGPKAQLISDPLTVSRFIDQAAYSHQLVIRAGPATAAFATTDDSGNLSRFRTACPDGTN